MVEVKTKEITETILVPVKVTKENSIIILESLDNIELHLNQIYEIDPKVIPFEVFDLKFIEGNRDIRKNPGLEKSLLEDGIMDPIIVNTKLEIIDGQHRYYYLKKHLQTYMFRIIDTEEKDFKHLLNLNINNKNWKTEDYIAKIAADGNPDYVELKKYIDTYVDDKQLISYTALSKVMEGNYNIGSTGSKHIKEGNFKVYNIENKPYKDFLEDLEFLKRQCHIESVTRDFVLPFYAMWSYRAFNIGVFVHKINNHRDKEALIEQLNNTGSRYKTFERMANVYNRYIRNENDRIVLELGQDHANGSPVFKPMVDKLDRNKVKVEQ